MEQVQTRRRVDRPGIVDWATGELDRDIEVENVPRRLAFSIFWLPAAGAAVLGALFVVRPVYTWLLDEDRPIEWLQFSVCLLASVCAIAAAARLRRAGAVLPALLLACIALGMFGIAGEEISWGQRVFAIGVPSGLAARNHQGELNIHDISSGFPVEDAFRVAQMMLALIGVVLPLLTRLGSGVVRNRLLRLLSPPLFLAPMFLAAFVFRFARLTFFQADIPAVISFTEWLELCLYSAMCAYCYLVYSGLRTTGRAPVFGDDYVGTATGASPQPLAVPRLVTVAAVLIAILTVVFAVVTVIQGVPLLDG